MFRVLEAYELGFNQDYSKITSSFCVFMPLAGLVA